MGTEKHLIRIVIGLVLFFIGSIVLMQFLSNAEADIIIVAKDRNGDYDKIQDTIDNATSGDTIRVYERVDENVEMYKSVRFVRYSSEVTIYRPGV